MRSEADQPSGNMRNSSLQQRSFDVAIRTFLAQPDGRHEPVAQTQAIDEICGVAALVEVLVIRLGCADVTNLALLVHDRRAEVGQIADARTCLVRGTTADGARNLDDLEGEAGRRCPVVSAHDEFVVAGEVEHLFAEIVAQARIRRHRKERADLHAACTGRECCAQARQIGQEQAGCQPDASIEGSDAFVRARPERAEIEAVRVFHQR